MSDRETIADARRLYHHMAHGGRWNLGVDTERLSTYVAQMERDADELDTLRGDLAETERERDEARSNYQFMVDRAVNEKLDGYRNLGQRAATAENERDTARQQLAEARDEIERLLRRRDHYECHPNPDPSWEESLDHALYQLAAEKELLALCRRQRKVLRSRSEGYRQQLVAMTERRESVEKALHEASESLRSISRLAGRDKCMPDMAQVRAYAESRYRVARGALVSELEAGS